MIDLIVLGIAGIAGILVVSDPLAARLWVVALLLGVLLIGAGSLLTMVGGGQVFI